MTSPAAFHMPADAQAHAHSHSAFLPLDGSPRVVHPGLFRPPPQSPPPSASGSLFLAPSAMAAPTSDPNDAFAQLPQLQQQQHQARRQINTAILRGPTRPPLVATTPSTAKRKRGPGGIDEWSSAADGGLASPAVGPVVTPTHVYSGAMDAGFGGFSFGFGTDGAVNAFGMRVVGGAVAGADDMEDSAHSDVDYRRTGGSQRPPTRDADGDEDIIQEKASPDGAMAGTPRCQYRCDQQQAKAADGWFTLNALGGVIGKVWDFCTAGAFRGFYAGGGSGYNIQSDGTVEPVERVPSKEHVAYGDSHDSGSNHNNDNDNNSDDNVNVNNHNSPHNHDFHHDLSSPVHETWPPPGYFPVDNPHDHRNPGDTPQIDDPSSAPAAKRRQVAESSEELRNWVIVTEPEEHQRKPIATAVATGTANPSLGLGVRSRMNPAVRRSAVGTQSSALPRRQYSTPPQKPQQQGGQQQHHQQYQPHTPRASLAGGTNPFGTGREFASFAPTRSPERGRSPIPPPATPCSKIPLPAHFSSIPRARSISHVPARPSSSASSAAAHAYTTMTGLPKPAPSPSASHLSPHHHHSASASASFSHRRNRSTASAANPRRPSIAESSHPSSSTPHYPNLYQSPFGNPFGNPSSTPANNTNDDGYTGSPHLTPEARRLARQRAQAEHEADVRMDSMNSQLETLIRLGREALGASIDVAGDDGWMDED